MEISEIAEEAVVPGDGAEASIMRAYGKIRDSEGQDAGLAYLGEQATPELPVITTWYHRLTAWQMRNAGALEEAIEYLGARVAPDMPGLQAFRFKLLHEIQSVTTLQSELLRAIEAVPTLPDYVESEYFEVLIRQSQRVGLDDSALTKLCDVTKRRVRSMPKAFVAWQALNHRLRFRERVVGRYGDVPHIVSLGLNCLPWHVPTMWGLRSAARVVDEFNPFSLAGHTLPGLIKALETDFEDYCSPTQIRTIETPNGHKLPLRKDRGAFWNHNRNTYWVKDETAHLRSDIAKKVAAFRRICQKDNLVFLLAKCDYLYPQEPLDFLTELNNALSRFTGTDRNRIVVTNQMAYDQRARVIPVDTHTQFIYAPYPREDYVWHVDETADSKEGLTYERQYVLALLSAMERLGAISRSAAPATN